MIGRRIKTLREKLNLKQIEFADMLSIPQNSLSQYENIEGKAIPSNILERIIEKTDVNANWLITGRGEMFGDGAVARAAARDVDPEIIEKLIESAKSNTAIKTLWLKALEADNEEERRSYIDALATLLNNIGNALK